MVVCVEESLLLGYDIMSYGSFRTSETNYPVRVSHVLEEQSSDTSTNVGLYAHTSKTLSPHSEGELQSLQLA
jgi:imidazoleglycerol phosphate dehydratase HisB